jgi:shikimate kinase
MKGSDHMKNLILTGMPACGKSTMGVVLAKTLGMKFIDTDLLIQEEENEKLQNIIDNRGMDAFLETEERILSSIEAENAVISTGGSAVYSDKAMKHLKSIGDVVYIKLSLPEIERRLDNIKTRGIAMKPGVTLADLYNQRVPLYEKYADIVLETEGMGIEESIEALIKKM